jgi:hypothetical protein
MGCVKEWMTGGTSVGQLVGGGGVIKKGKTMSWRRQSRRLQSTGKTGKASVDTALVQQVFRCNIWSDFKFVFSNVETASNSELSRAYYSAAYMDGHHDIFKDWEKSMSNGRRTTNGKQTSVTSTTQRKPSLVSWICSGYCGIPQATNWASTFSVSVVEIWCDVKDGWLNAASVLHPGVALVLQGTDSQEAEMRT